MQHGLALPLHYQVNLNSGLLNHYIACHDEKFLSNDKENILNPLVAKYMCFIKLLVYSCQLRKKEEENLRK